MFAHGSKVPSVASISRVNRIPGINRIKKSHFSTSSYKCSETTITDDVVSKFATNSTSKQNSDTYISAFNKIMSHKSEPKEKGTLQLIFEKNLKSRINKQNNQNNQNQNNQSNETKIITSKDIRNFPLSVSSNIVTQDFQSKNLIEEIQKKHELKESINSTLKYMESINSDFELIKFIESIIIDFSQTIKIENQDNNFKNQELTDSLILKIKLNSNLNPENPIKNQFTIPILLSNSMKLLSTKFKSPIEAISIFQFVKNLDMKTYTFCCNIEVYNEFLERSWQNYKDIHMIDSIIYEMKLNGIIGDMDTISILGLVINDMEKLMNDEFGGMFWNKEDENLVKSVVDFRNGLMERI